MECEVVFLKENQNCTTAQSFGPAIQIELGPSDALAQNAGPSIFSCSWFFNYHMHFSFCFRYRGEE